MFCARFQPPAFTCVLIFILMVSFLEKLIEVDCGENCRSLSKVGESHWILLTAQIFVRQGSIGAELVRRQVVALEANSKAGRIVSL